MGDRYNPYKAELAEKAVKHTALMEQKYHDEITHSAEATTRYAEVVSTDKKGTGENVCPVFLQTDTVSALFEIEETENVALLNFASYKNVGGNFLGGSKAQEEMLCHESFLFNVLQANEDYYLMNSGDVNRGLYRNRAMYSPDIYFFRDGKVKKCDVLTCAAPNRSLLLRYKQITEAENLEVLKSRVKFIRDIVLDKGVKVFITGAWGCGVFRQEPEVVRDLFEDAFKNTGVLCIYTIPDLRNYSVFSRSDASMTVSHSSYFS